MSIYLNADCMDEKVGLPSYPDNYFQLCIVDPPYGIDWMQQIQNPNTGAFWKSYENKPWDCERPSIDYFTELQRVSRNQIIWGGNYFADMLMPSPCWVIWDKMQEFSGAVFEMAWTSFDSPAKAFRMSRIEAYGKGKDHPTQKPMALYRWLINHYAKQGDKILDTHVGSASSLVVYEEMGFEYVGFELDADYYRDSCKRLEAFRAQPKLFTGSEIFEASKPPTLF